MIDGITFIEHFYENTTLYDRLVNEVTWNKDMKSRWTASFGRPYRYNGPEHDFRPMWPEMNQIAAAIEKEIGFLPNNCFLNYYFENLSRMGFHADNTEFLEPDTGIAVLSLGVERIFRVRRIENKEERYNYPLPEGSLIYMTNEVQETWHHGIPKSKVEGGRISLTFRKIQEQ